MLHIGAARHMGMAEDAMPSAEMFKIEHVSKRVYAAIAQTCPVVNGDSAIICRRTF